MIVMISHAKTMRRDPYGLEAPPTVPRFLRESRELLSRIQKLSFPELKAVLGCSESLAREAYDNFQRMNLDRGDSTPAILAYSGIQYQYMAPGVFTDREFRWLGEHLRILSGFYGVLRPTDGVLPCRLEMQARCSEGAEGSLYAFWGDRLARSLEREAGGVILNLASEEYARAVRPHLSPDTRFVTPVFGELQPDGKVREKGVHVKMARGRAVRYLAEQGAEEPEAICGFSDLGFCFCPERSAPDTPVFIRKP